MTENLSPRSRLVHDALREAGIPGEIVVLPDVASTAPLAAAALGVEVGAIANSLVFWSDGEPLLVMTSGAHRVDTAALAARLGRTSIARASAEQVRDATGQAIGGVAPTGHPTPLTTIIDEDLAAFTEIWAAGGTPHTVFPMTFDELVALTGGQVLPVAGSGLSEHAPHEHIPGPGEPSVPELEIDETIPPRPEEEIADVLRAEPDVKDHSRHPH